MQYMPPFKGKLTVSNTLTGISVVYICYGIWYSSRYSAQVQKV